ncbi:hypothetical protein FJZ55_09525, partial [Candidatus Woesearchaeota archaeon]|nr:hypothetical protein [Candidatus Woesearchaeota archaeon]
MDFTRERCAEGPGLLYPMMVIAAIAVIVFSILGIASIVSWMPSGLSGSGAGARAGAAFECSECGVIESVRELERDTAS